MGIKESLNNLRDDLEVSRPTIFDLDKKEDADAIKSLMEANKIVKAVDYIDEERKELSLIRNPKLLLEKLESQKVNQDEDGVWVYYPWRQTIVHCLDEENYNKLRLSRNRELINEKEQAEFGELRIGYAGLNVGNSIALCVALEGGGQQLTKLADNDTLDFSNLNRFRAGVCELGINKAVLSARQIYEINPFAKIEVLPEGIKEDEVGDFLKKPKIDILVEEMDNLGLKIKIRKEARENGIPVVMITGNGAGVIVDIERFDQNRNLPLLSGHLEEGVIQRIEAGPKTLEDKVSLARDFMGKDFLAPRLNQSFDLIGKKIVGIPQISEASYLRGAVVCNILRNLIGENIKSGRYHFNLSDLFKEGK